MNYTPEQFLAKMKELAKEPDVEKRHKKADQLMCDALEQAGFSDGVTEFKKMGKWYA